MTIERKRFFLLTLLAGTETSLLSLPRQPRENQTVTNETGFRIKSETGFDSLVKFRENLWPIKHFNKYFRKF